MITMGGMTRTQLEIFRTAFVPIGALLSAGGVALLIAGYSWAIALLAPGLLLYWAGIYVWVVHLKGRGLRFMALGVLFPAGPICLCFVEEC